MDLNFIVSEICDLIIVSCYCSFFRHLARREGRTPRIQSREQSIEKLFSFPMNYGGAEEQTCKNSNLVWVKRDFLQRFLSCSDDMGLESIPVTREGNEHFLINNRKEKCEHGHMHPSEAKNGKMIPESTFSAICDVLMNEWKDIHGVSLEGGKVTDGALPKMCDEIIHLKDIHCEECGIDYKMERNALISKLENFLKLMSALNDCKNIGRTEGSDFALSRKFVEAFLKFGDKMCSAQESELLFGEIDSVDLSALTGMGVNKDIVTDDEFEVFQSPVNEDVACEYVCIAEYVMIGD